MEFMRSGREDIVDSTLLLCAEEESTPRELDRSTGRDVFSDQLSTLVPFGPEVNDMAQVSVGLPHGKGIATGPPNHYADLECGRDTRVLRDCEGSCPSFPINLL